MNKNNDSLSGITLNNVGKKFRNNWIFRAVSFHVNKGEQIAINGHNGSGKSTLLQIIGGYISVSEGTVEYSGSSGKIESDQIYHHISLASPYMDLVDEFTLVENIDFFIRFKPLTSGINSNDLLTISGLGDSAHKQLKFFSSGMKQKVKLTLAFLANTDLLLLDEPLSNLDQAGYEWYKMMAAKYTVNKTVFVCSNMVKEETFFCTRSFNIETFQQK